ncbi:MAG: zinc ribbon domain-containing protein [Sedimentisphaerales bacterium]|nr:zinc ribbon domain-containing protein [Sedimentisphaerales bacterium]
MPIYQYKATDKGCDYCRGGFEIIQSMKDKPLTQCPRCRASVRKVPSLCSGYTPMLSDSNLRDKGFTKLKKRGDGTYEKTT